MTPRIESGIALAPGRSEAGAAATAAVRCPSPMPASGADAKMTSPVAARDDVARRERVLHVLDARLDGVLHVLAGVAGARDDVARAR